MSRNAWLPVMVVSALTGGYCLPATAGTFDYKVISVKGQSNCLLAAINVGGQAVGSCIETDKSYVGLAINAGKPKVYSKVGGFLTVNSSGIALGGNGGSSKPAAFYTLVNVATTKAQTIKPDLSAIPKGLLVLGMNDSMTVVGLGFPSSKSDAAIIVQNKAVTLLDPPGAQLGYGGAEAINNPGVVGGFYLDANNFTNIYTYQNGSYFAFDPSQINEIAKIADDGAVLESNGSLYQNGTWTGVVPPNALAFNVTGIGPGDEVIGSVKIVGSKLFQGYIERNGSFYFINVPGYSNTRLYGVDANGDLVGAAYNHSKAEIPFIATCPPAQAPCTQ